MAICWSPRCDRALGCLCRPAILSALATFFIFFLSLGNISSFVILYVYLQEDFNASAVETGWVGSIAWAVMNFLVPVSSALYVRFGCQRVVLAGVLLASAGLLATSFASQLWIIYITYGLMFGGGSNMMLTSSLNFVTALYPGKNNIRATSCVSSGQPVGLLVLSASLERACFHLGWRNALRISSGITLGMGLVCTILLHSTNNTNAPDDELECQPGASGADSTQAETSNLAEGSRQPPADTSPSSKPRSPAVSRGQRGKKHYRPLQSKGDLDWSTCPPANLIQSVARQYSKSSHELSGGSDSGWFSGEVEAEPRLASSLFNLEAGSSQPTEQSGSRSGEGEDKEAAANGDLGSDQEELTVDLLVADNQFQVATPPPQSMSTFLQRYLELLRQPGHWLFFGGIIGSSVAALFNVIHFMSFALSVGVEESKASLLLVVMSGTEIAVRVVIFVVINRIPFTRTLLFAIVCVMGALATYTIVRTPSFALVTTYIIVLGIVRSTVYAIAFGATVDVFGVNRALESYTSLLLSYGIAGALGSTIGISKDIMGDFTISLHIIAALYLLSAILFILAHVWRRRNPLIDLSDQAQHDTNGSSSQEEKRSSNLDNCAARNGDAVTSI